MLYFLMRVLVILACAVCDNSPSRELEICTLQYRCCALRKSFKNSTHLTGRVLYKQHARDGV